MMQRDYILRLIEQCIQSLARTLQLRQNQQFGQAMDEINSATDELLGPLRPMVERLDAATAITLVGRFELDRIRMYAGLVGETGFVHRDEQRPEAAQSCCQRALELYAAVSLAGAMLDAADLARISALTAVSDPAQLDGESRGEISRLMSAAT